jgi:hypothetical protein
MHIFLSRAMTLAAAMFLSMASASYAQTLEEQAAAKETYVDGLRLYPSNNTMQSRGVQIAYVETSTSPGNGQYFCGGMSDSQIKTAAAITSAAISKLPASAWQTIQLKYILLCSETRANNREIGGIPVPPIQLLMLNAGSSPSAASRFPLTVMHELYHLIEMQTGHYNDTVWNGQFSGYDNSYGTQAGNVAFGSGGNGFINAYGKSFPHEERAELFAIQLLAANALDEHIRNSKDDTLRSKRDYVVRQCIKILGDGAC